MTHKGRGLTAAMRSAWARAGAMKRAHHLWQMTDPLVLYRNGRAPIVCYGPGAMHSVRQSHIGPEDAA